jgi:hypothetical protein
LLFNYRGEIGVMALTDQLPTIGARRRRTEIAATARRRGDRMTMLFAAVHSTEPASS